MMPSVVNGRKKPGILLWHDLNIEQLHTIKESTDKLGTIANIFGLERHKEDLKSAILVDLFYYTLQFSEKNDFSDEQTSAFVSIVKSVHERAVETPYGNVDETFQYLKELLLCHSVKRPPFSVQLYSADQVQMIADYTLNTYFKHYKLYKYAFTPKIRLNLHFEYSNIPETPVPDEDENQAGDEVKSESAEAEEKTDVASTSNETVEEDTAAVKELKSLITATLTEQVNQLRFSVEEQLKASNEALSQKLGFSCGGKESPKSPSRNKKKGR